MMVLNSAEEVNDGVSEIQSRKWYNVSNLFYTLYNLHLWVYIEELPQLSKIY